jgi:hypothetical protein
MPRARPAASQTPEAALLVVASSDSDIVACKSRRDSMLATGVRMHRLERCGTTRRICWSSTPGMSRALSQARVAPAKAMELHELEHLRPAAP